MASQAAYMRDPSPSNFAAHIQFAESRTSRRSLTGADARFVSISQTARRAMRAGLSAESWGASPTATATPSVEKWLLARTAQLLRGSWKGPTHCWRATRPVTDRSALCTRKRFEQTAGRPKTPSSAARKSGGPPRKSAAAATASGSGATAGVVEVKTFLGMSASTSSRGRSTIFASEPPRLSTTTTRPSAATSPTTSTWQRSRSAMARSRGMSPGSTRSAFDSWYSAPQSSSGVIVASPSESRAKS